MTRRNPAHQMSEADKGGASMRCSVVMPTTGERSSAMNTVRTVVAHAGKKFDELLIVHNGSHNHALQTTVEELSKPTFRVRYIHEPVVGLLAGRHRGVAESNSDILVFIDDDIEVQAAWAEAILDAFENSSVGLVGGPSRPVYESTPPEWLSQCWNDEDGVRACQSLSLLDAGDARREIAPNYIWGLNFSIRRSLLKQLGGFHPDGVPWFLRRFRGDGETGLCRKLAMSDFLALYEPLAGVNHIVPSSRLTIDYFQRRAILQGISGSYADIRARGAKTVPEDQPSTVRRIGSRIRQKIFPLRSTVNHNNERIVFENAASQGYAFHQAEVKRDPELLAWVLQKDYWNYSYPPTIDYVHGTNSR